MVQPIGATSSLQANNNDPMMIRMSAVIVTPNASPLVRPEHSRTEHTATLINIAAIRHQSRFLVIPEV